MKEFGLIYKSVMRFFEQQGTKIVNCPKEYMDYDNFLGAFELKKIKITTSAYVKGTDEIIYRYFIHIKFLFCLCRDSILYFCITHSDAPGHWRIAFRYVPAAETHEIQTMASGCRLRRSGDGSGLAGSEAAGLYV